MFKSLYLSANGRINRKTFVFLGFIPYLLSIRLLTSVIFQATPVWLFIIPYSILLLLFLAMAVKRAHDLGYSGRYLWLLLIPAVNVLILLYIVFVRGENSDNEFGGEPKDWKAR